MNLLLFMMWSRNCNKISHSIILLRSYFHCHWCFYGCLLFHFRFYSHSTQSIWWHLWNDFLRTMWMNANYSWIGKWPERLLFSSLILRKKFHQNKFKFSQIARRQQITLKLPNQAWISPKILSPQCLYAKSTKFIPKI